MARTLKLSAFNIVTHPHKPEFYSEVFSKAFALHRQIGIRGETRALLGSCYNLESGNITSPITGEIFTFLEIDKDNDWFDIAKGEQATDRQTEEVTIPDNLRPHLKRVRYVFFPKKHMFIYVREDSKLGIISPASMEYFLNSLLNDPKVLENKKFHEVEIRLVQDKAAIDEILSTLSIDRLTIKIRLPNGDGPLDAMAAIEEEMNEQNLIEYTTIQKAKKGEKIDPNERTVALMEKAVTDGSVEAVGRDENGLAKSINTQSKPLVEPVRYDGKSAYLDFFINAAMALLGKIKQ